jgi:hypothetical protein
VFSVITGSFGNSWLEEFRSQALCDAADLDRRQTLHSMTYQRRLDVNEPDVIDSPYSPPRANVSQGDPAWPLQRSQSTPAAAQIPLQTKPGEKKKNKLGYSRTPVACGKISLLTFFSTSLSARVAIQH